MKAPRKQRPTSFGRRIGLLLYRGRLGLLVIFCVLACEGTSESTPGSHPKDAPPEAVSQAVPVDEPIQLAARAEERGLPPVSAGPPRRDAKPEVEITAELKAALNWALLEYRTAFVGRDLAKLESIWSMGVVERLLIKNAWSTCEKIELSLETQEMRIDGVNAIVDFEQDLTFLCPNEARTSHSTLSASMERGPDGQWTIARIGDRQALPARTASAGPARLAPHAMSAVSDASMHRALETLSDYESALQRCDLVGLARVWIMTDLERQILQGLCFRRGQLDVTISQPEVSQVDGKVSIDFTHDLVRRGASGPQQTRSRLTALLVERDDGHWAIWKVRAAE